MAIAKNPKRNIPAVSQREVDAFISGGGHPTGEEISENKKPVMIRIAPEMLERIDRAAKRLGISRSAFIVSSTAERLERME